MWLQARSPACTCKWPAHRRAGGRPATPLLARSRTNAGGHLAGARRLWAPCTPPLGRGRGGWGTRRDGHSSPLYWRAHAPGRDTGWSDYVVPSAPASHGSAPQRRDARRPEPLPGGCGCDAWNREGEPRVPTCRGSRQAWAVSAYGFPTDPSLWAPYSGRPPTPRNVPQPGPPAPTSADRWFTRPRHLKCQDASYGRGAQPLPATGACPHTQPLTPPRGASTAPGVRGHATRGGMAYEGAHRHGSVGPQFHNRSPWGLRPPAPARPQPRARHRHRPIADPVQPVFVIPREKRSFTRACRLKPFSARAPVRLVTPTPSPAAEGLHAPGAPPAMLLRAAAIVLRLAPGDAALKRV